MAERLRRGSLRARLVGLASLVVTAVLVVGGLALGWALRAALVDDLRDAAVTRARELASLAADGAVPRSLPIGDADEALVQIVSDGEVIAASGNASGLPPLELRLPAVGDTTVTELDTVPLEDADDAGFVAAATTTAAPDGTPVTVVVVSSLEDITETLSRAAGIAVGGLPLLVAALGAGMWVLVGRTLAPVESIRAEAASIGGPQLHRRVPEPGTDDEVGRLARTLNAMLSRLEAANANQQRFVADAAHELRTPVATIRARVETARSTRKPIDWAEIADDVLAETVRMQRLTEQLLLLARADGGSLDVRQQPVDLDDVVLGVVSSESGSHDLQVDVSAVEPVQVSGDPVLIEQALRNLVDNARRHARARIGIGVHRSGDAAVVTVDDDGVGVAPEHRRTIFERFVRLDPARTTAEGGAGLGLAIVDDIVAAHGGTVEVGDGPLPGARFTIRLPLRPRDEPPTDRVATPG